MATVTWAGLAKSQTDPETIEEAIDRKILEHNADESAHLEVGQSLQSHKASDIIDHLALSVVQDKLAKFSVDFTKFVGDAYMMMSCFESIDGWQQEGSPGYSINSAPFDLYIYTGNSANYDVNFYIFPVTGYPLVDFSKSTFFQTTVKTNSVVAQLTEFSLGDNSNYGFRINEANLYAFHYKTGVGEYITVIPDIDVTEFNVYRAEFDVENSHILFYVNGVLKATHTVNLPSGTWDTLFCYYVKTSVALYKSISVKDLIIYQKK